MVDRVGMVEIAARPEPLQMHAAETAVVVVDMQNDFASAGGMFDRAGVDVRGIQAIVAPIATLLDAARTAGILVLYLKMGFDPDLGNAGAPTAPIWIKHLPFEAGVEVRAPDGSPSRILVRDTWNTTSSRSCSRTTVTSSCTSTVTAASTRPISTPSSAPEASTR